MIMIFIWLDGISIYPNRFMTTAFTWQTFCFLALSAMAAAGAAE